MLGSVRWNFSMGALGMLLAFIFSLGNNGFVVSSMRGLYAFAAFFLLAYMLRGALHIIVGSPAASEVPGEAQGQDQPADPNVGTNVDMTTEDEDLNQLLKSQIDSGDAGFKPFEPTRLVSTQNKEPEQLAEAIRQLAEEGNDPKLG